MPDELPSSLAPPPGLDGATFVQMLIDPVRQIERVAARDRARTGTRGLGTKTVLKQRVDDRPRSREPRRRLSPRVACRNMWRRIEALVRNRGFIRAYRAARTLLLAGADVLFPAGSYWLPPPCRCSLRAAPALAGAGVEFVVIGGCAVAAYARLRGRLNPTSISLC
jgi:putative transposase